MNESTIGERIYYYNYLEYKDYTFIYNSISVQMMNINGKLTEKEVIIAINAYESGFAYGNTCGANRIRRHFKELLKTE